MFKKTLIVAALASSFAMPAFAEEASPITFNASLTSNYIYRGITQTAHSPAIQGGVDYAHASGFYAGAWGSNVTWIKDSGALASGNKSIELDTYFGFKKTIADVGYDVGFIRYNYLGTATATSGFAAADTAELYGAASYKWFTAKYSYSLLDGFLTVPNSKGTSYVELNGSYTLEGNGVTLGAHLGHQAIKNASIYDYTDYKLSASKDFSGYVVAGALTGTNVSPSWTYATGGNWGKTVLALSVLRAF